jgi:hypothetical protein
MIEQAPGIPVRAGTGATTTTTTGGRRRRGLAGLRRVPLAARVWILSAVLAGLTLALWFGLLHRQPGHDAPVSVPWVVMAVAFFAAELKVVDVHFRREKHSFSLSEFPAVISFFLLSPDEYFLALMTGAGAALLLSRQSPTRLVSTSQLRLHRRGGTDRVLHCSRSPTARRTRGTGWPRSPRRAPRPSSAPPRSRPPSRSRAARRSSRSCRR